MSATESLRDRTLRGMGWAVAMRWMSRLVGIVSMVILARLLTPDDYGVIAMCMMVVGLGSVLFEVGVNTWLIQKEDADDLDYDTAWTVRLLQGLAASALIASSIPVVVHYFEEPRVSAALLCLAGVPALQALANIGVVRFQKELDIRRDFQLLLWQRLSAFLVTICAAWILRSYWALVIGTLSSAVVGVALSYAFHPYRPSWSLERVREMAGFSAWMLVRNIGAYGQTRIDQVVVSGELPAHNVGVYNLAAEISELPTAELLTPLGRAMFPAFSLLKGDRQRLARAFQRSFGVIVVLGFPVSVGMAAVAEPLVAVVLGPRWHEVVPLLQVLPFVGFFIAVRYTAATVLTVLGHLRLIALSFWIQIAGFVAAVFLLFDSWTVVDLALVRLVLGAAMSALILVQTLRAGLARLTDLASALHRPALAAALMFGAIVGLRSSLAAPPFVELGACVLLGVASYGVSLFALWGMSGKPAAAETEILAIVSSRLRA